MEGEPDEDQNGQRGRCAAEHHIDVMPWLGVVGHLVEPTAKIAHWKTDASFCVPPL
jgi:hypothetical protein